MKMLKQQRDQALESDVKDHQSQSFSGTVGTGSCTQYYITEKGGETSSN